MSLANIVSLRDRARSIVATMNTERRKVLRANIGCRIVLTNEALHHHPQFRGHVGKLLEVKRTRAGVDFGDLGVWDFAILGLELPTSEAGGGGDFVSDPLRHFREVWLLDFEFYAPPGERSQPLCLVAREFRSGRTLRVWADELAAMFQPPFDIGPDTLFVAYYASAELGCFEALGWPAPARILDLFVEFRQLTNGLGVPCGNGLLGALAYHGIGSIEAAEKDELRALAMRGGPYTEAEQVALLDYCQTDVESLEKLLPAMLPTIDLPRALLRGRYMAAAARMEFNGTPIDTDTLAKLLEHWEEIKLHLIREIDKAYGVYVPTGQTINPESTLGAAILVTAAEWEIDPHALAVAVDEVWANERDAHQEHDAALVEARKKTGLTTNRISRIENAGGDASTVAHLDETARELAGELPALGIGTGYDGASNSDDTDYAGGLWQLLREPARRSKPKHDPDILRQAARMVADDGGQWRGSLSFNAQRFADWLIRTDIPWPRLESGELALDDSTFRQMARQYPAVAPLRELRHTLGDLRLFDLAVGSDNRNRCLLSAFRSTTGRNQPSNARFIFGPSCWLRGLIQPEPGRAVAYVDWSQQEWGIAAALSGDVAMQAAYTSGDPYLTFAKQAKAVPTDATKESHKAERERFKVCALAVQYGIGSKSLAVSLGQPEAYARELLRLHSETYRRFWEWSQAAVDHAMLRGRLWTVFGWQVQVGHNSNPRSLANFPMQANGAEMLRLACCLATERGVAVCCPVHDAILVEGDVDDIEATVDATQEAMREASRVVLSGFELATDAKIIRHPERYMDPRGATMWNTITSLIGGQVPAASCSTSPEYTSRTTQQV